MTDRPQTPREWLLYALKAYNIAILSEKDNFVTVEKNYVIEIEHNGVFKLLSEGAVVAPFRDLEELCRFIKMSP
jgi:hypothetical protein